MNLNGRLGSLYLSTFFGVLTILLLAGVITFDGSQLSEGAIMLFCVLIGFALGLIVAFWLVELAERIKSSSDE
jgi:hypothetical protein